MSKQEKNSFVVNKEWEGHLRYLDDKQQAELLRMMFAYNRCGKVDESESPIVNSVFLTMRIYFDANNQKYEDVCQRRSEAGKKSAENRKKQSVPTNSTSVDSVPTNSTESESESESESDADAVIVGASADGGQYPDDFEQFWAVYPKPQGKMAAFEEWRRRSPDAALLAKILAAVKAQSNQESWQREGGRFIPMPAAWIAQQRWDDEPVKVKIGPKKGGFNDFDQRDYGDPEELEKKLFGLE